MPISYSLVLYMLLDVLTDGMSGSFIEITKITDIIRNRFIIISNSNLEDKAFHRNLDASHLSHHDAREHGYMIVTLDNGGYIFARSSKLKLATA